MLQSTEKASLEETFSILATERSDCSSAKRGGDLGYFQKNQMQSMECVTNS